MNSSTKWNLFKLCQELKDAESTEAWLSKVGLLPSEKICKKHRKKMNIQSGHNFGLFVCNYNGKRHSIARASNTWLENCHISPEECMVITYCFANKFSFENTIKESSIKSDSTISSETVADRFTFAREVCMIALDKEYGDSGQIGGPGCIVEIDETKIGKRKYERGRLVDGSWIVGMIQRNSNNYRLEICPENSRNSDTLTEIIKKHIKPGTEIQTDCWAGYRELNSHGYIHKKVNHTEHFVDPESGAHTQNIESSWRTLKYRLTRGGVRKEHLDLHLCEFLWRRRLAKEGKDPFQQLIEDIKVVYCGK